MYYNSKTNKFEISEREKVESEAYRILNDRVEKQFKEFEAQEAKAISEGTEAYMAFMGMDDPQTPDTGGTTPTPGTGLQFLTGQILYNQIDLNISAGNNYNILKKMFENINRVVTKTELEGISPRFPHCVGELRVTLKTLRLPYEIKTVAGEGYKLIQKTVRKKTV
jgi:hypothetical protein